MLGIAYLGLIVFIIFTELIRHKTNVFDFLSLFNIIFILMYPFPGFIFDAEFSRASNIQTPIAIFLGYFFVFIGFYSKSAQKYGNNILIQSRSDNIVMKVAIVLLLLTCLSIHLYSSQYGGFLTTMANAQFLRQGIYTAEVGDKGSKFGFFLHFMSLGILGSYILASFVCFKKHKDKKIILYTSFLFSVITSFVVITIKAARSSWVYYFLLFYLAVVVKTRKLYLQVIIIFLYPTILFILYGKPLFLSLTALPDGLFAVVDRFIDTINSQPNNEFGFNQFIEYFGYPVSSLDAAFNADYDLRLFVDFVYGFATLLPERLLNVEVPDTITFYNTLYIVGPVDYSIPPGFLAFGIYSMSWIGLIIVCFTYGWIGCYLETILSRQINNIYWMPFIYVLIIKIWTDFVSAGDPKILIMANIGEFLSIFIFFAIATKISFGRHHNYEIHKSRKSNSFERQSKLL